MSGSVEGLDNTISNLNREISSIEKRSVEGIRLACLVAQAEAQRRVPVEHGFLKSSAYTRKSPENPNVVELGFSSDYALYVHENLEQKWKGLDRASGLGKYWGPKGEPKFLENALNIKSKEMLAIIVKTSKVKK